MALHVYSCSTEFADQSFFSLWDLVITTIERNCFLSFPRRELSFAVDSILLIQRNQCRLCDFWCISGIIATEGSPRLFNNISFLPSSFAVLTLFDLRIFFCGYIFCRSSTPPEKKKELEHHNRVPVSSYLD